MKSSLRIPFNSSAVLHSDRRSRDSETQWTPQTPYAAEEREEEETEGEGNHNQNDDSHLDTRISLLDEYPLNRVDIHELMVVIPACTWDRGGETPSVHLNNISLSLSLSLGLKEYLPVLILLPLCGLRCL
ncbi:hypothetical protein PMAYCL1PPCAC_07140 [Pristionchus mayeri]|uniref:Uncharacterized protein n=1 Tax=Pristionchus mayeri TaxID=1317129 RepID=A0AAN4ZH99_9BILA|nr:hypothetical protein PMAYCL1PPCAC_07140 [Pristionchus mayeri]